MWHTSDEPEEETNENKHEIEKEEIQQPYISKKIRVIVVLLACFLIFYFTMTCFTQHFYSSIRTSQLTDVPGNLHSKIEELEIAVRQKM